ncbi:MAG: hypothetical protein K8T91_21555 [Planctomycetes bacterium]|nr:hypothetical protein [Planctomycetota bacterium]
MIKRRLERVLVAPLRATVWDAVSVQRGNHDKKIEEQKPLDPKVAKALRPNMERFYNVCQKQGVTYTGEARPIAEERAEMTKLFAAAGSPLRLKLEPVTK